LFSGGDVVPIIGQGSIVGINPGPTYSGGSIVGITPGKQFTLTGFSLILQFSWFLFQALHWRKSRSETWRPA
jgi:hypothetical protein